MPILPISPNSNALMCESCYKSTSCSGNVPPMSVHSGVKYGLAWMRLPVLSMLAKCSLASFMIYAHIFTIGGGHGQKG